MNIRNAIPNAVTLMNLLAGTLAIVFAFNPAETTNIFGIELIGWKWAAVMIIAAAVFDFFDGFVARALHAKSELGAQLDSLCDLVSFGVAPALLLFNVVGRDNWAAYSALFIPLMGALRLAIFNLDATQTTTFRGLPIPSNAVFWIGFVGALADGLPVRSTVLVAIVVAMSLMMVCRLPMFSLKLSSIAPNRIPLHYILLAGAVVFIWMFGFAGMALAVLLYIVLSFLKSVIKITYN